MEIQKNVKKEVIVRTFEPNMQALKATARSLSSRPDVSIRLFGQAGEVLIVLTALAYASAAATELTEGSAEVFERALGDACYGRGKGSLAYASAGEMVEHESIIAAADEVTGTLIGEEFGNTKRGPKVFDFGENSYNEPRMIAKLDKYISGQVEDERDALQNCAIYAEAAQKCVRADFGASITGLDSGTVYAAVTYKKNVYIRAIPQGPDAEKTAALSILDMARCLLLSGTSPTYAKMFTSGRFINWDAPLTAKKSVSKSRLVPILVLVALVCALGVSIWYLFNTFIIPGDDAISVAGQSASQSFVDVVGGGDGTSTAGSTANSTPSGDGAASTPASTPATDTPGQTSGVVHPFG